MEDSEIYLAVVGLLIVILTLCALLHILECKGRSSTRRVGYRNLVLNGPTCIIIIDQRGTSSSVNRSFITAS